MESTQVFAELRKSFAGAAALFGVVLMLGVAACKDTTPKPPDEPTPEPPKPAAPLESWRSVLNLDATKRFFDVTWSESASRFVAVGGLSGIGGVIMYSADGVSWTEATRTSDWLYGVTHSESSGRFVAVGSGTVMYSADGASWTAATSARLNAVTWSGTMGRFVAVGNYGNVMYSADGASWRWTEGAARTAQLQAVTWSEALSRFVAVGYDRDTRVPVVAYSDDGTNWSMAAAVPGDVGLSSVAWSDTLSRFVAVGGRGTVLYSADGANWSAGTSGTTEWLEDVTWSDELSRFFAVGGGDILYSADGESWFAAEDHGDLGDFQGVTWGGARGVAVGYDGSIASSADGNLWTMSGPTGGDIPTVAFRSVAWGGSAARFVAVAHRAIIHSSAGTTWSVASSADRTYYSPSDVTWSDSLSRFVAVGRSISYSTDGDSWVEVSDFSRYYRNQYLNAVAWSDSLSRFVAVGYGYDDDYDAGTAVIAYSDAGTAWSMAASGGTSERLSAVAWSDSLSRFVAVGRNGAIVYSDDGETWSMAADSGAYTHDFRGVAWSDSLSRFVAVGNDDGIFYSDDGDRWHRASFVSFVLREVVHLTDVTWGGSHFVAVGRQGVILHSADGKEWTTGSTGTERYLSGVTWSDSLSRYVAVGDGVILASP